MADSVMKKLFSKIKIFYFRLPAELRILPGPLIGGLIGLTGGIAGLVFGLILGHLIQELFGQFMNDREIIKFYRNSGSFEFDECENGLAAFCGLGILAALKSAPSGNGEIIIRETCTQVKKFFPLADSATTEHFCRIAWQERKNLNPENLFVSLSDRVGARVSQAGSDTILISARELLQRIYPENKSEKENPWKVLGIAPETPLAEVRYHYHKLAAQFHPDALLGLDNEHLETASRAFITIREAYREIMENSRPMSG